ncbi:hypothetical protein TRFO_28432 [Tritrichomonas foetus]|uniref:Uncharacterized protein n=1 Tax=Tritrichomonas foetus TaxID=1144522 RepID=A0A1J4K3L1_9EUKA|nr:hypothetical protein TRFO_28432 [Tritrichomonas foetus]|eukprot:OHT04077.1 hypothetical protein TRFO_28432 [Tritrichomonas foetus]
MSEKSEFTQAFEVFQKDITGILHELAGTTDYFRSVATFPLPAPPAPIQGQFTHEKRHRQQKSEHQSHTEAEQHEFTQNEIDEIIIACSKRTSLDFKSKGFLKNIRKKLPGFKSEDLLQRIEVLIENGSIEKK